VREELSAQADAEHGHAGVDRVAQQVDLGLEDGVVGDVTHRLRSAQ
jgi:hypothetical protein